MGATVDNAPAEEVAKMSDRNLALLRFFAGAVTFTVAACIVIRKVDLGLDDVQNAWELATDAVHFVAVLRVTAPDFPGREAARMAGHLKRMGKTAAADVAAASSQQQFVQAVAAAAAADPSPAAIAKATEKAMAATRVDVGKSNMLRDVMYHGAELLSQPAEDEKAARKLKQLSLLKGAPGASTHHLRKLGVRTPGVMLHTFSHAIGLTKLSVCRCLI